MKHLKISRKFGFILLISMFFSVPLFAQNDYTEPEINFPVFHFVPYYAATIPGEEDYSIPVSIRNNEFFLESLRLSRLALETFDFGDYDASAGFAEEAIRYALLSDEYTADQLVAEAKRYVDWADYNNIIMQYPDEYYEGKNYYETGVLANLNSEWNEAITSASKSIRIFAALLGTAEGAGPLHFDALPLPGQYTVRTWAVERDCLWNIAAYPWVYGDPERWLELFEANRFKLPDPTNPDWIEPGMVLDIPSIRGEPRRGMWDPNITYVTP